MDERNAIAGLRFVERTGETDRAPIHRYTFPFQETAIRAGDELQLSKDEKIGSVSDELLLLCLQYNPMTGTYGPAIAKILKIAGILFLGVIVWFVVRSLRDDKKKESANTQVGTGTV